MTSMIDEPERGSVILNSAKEILSTLLPSKG